MKWLCFALIVLLDFLACTMMCVSTGHTCFTAYDMIPLCGISLFIATAIIAVCVYKANMFPQKIQKLIKISIEDC